ncbi:hypothetical protein AURDEDRAFT_123872 [Auricularia subglabra TFB-10046 SS5]|nr:hypothetical protein AURDEDRAFT_123872 [Auricularia subglabra TFB-10046 SS5]
MQSTCKVFLAPRAGAGEPDVVITRAPNGLLLAAVSCNCPRNGPCKRHDADELLRRARDHHKAVAPLVPCLFSTNPRQGQADTPMGHVKLHKPVPATSLYAPTTVGTADADPANVKPGKLWMISYLPACTLDASASWDPTGPDAGLGAPMPLVFERGFDFEFKLP